MRLGFNLEAKVPIFLGGTWIHGDNFPLGLMINISSILFRKEYQIKNLFELPFAGGFLPKPWNQFTKRQFFACKKILDPDSWCLLHVGPRDFYIWISWGAKVAGGGGVCLWVNSGNSWRSKIQIVILSILFLPNIKFKFRNLHSPLVSIFSYKSIHSITRPNASWLQKHARDRWIRKEGGTWRCCRKWNWKVFWEVTALMIWTAPRWWVALASNLWRFFVVWFCFLGETGSCRIAVGGSFFGSICKLVLAVTWW